MTTIRKPAVAGAFYPASPEALEREIREYLAQVPDSGDPVAPKALIVPHAGYVYSGPVAAYAYKRLAPLRDTVTRVVLLGPSHRIPVRGIAACSADFFETPLGAMRVDKPAIEAALKLPAVRILDEAHLQEHSLEVQLPFIQEVLGDVKLAPFSVGDASASEVGELIELLWGGSETLIVISSDLSHYHDYQTAVALDRRTSERIASLSYQEIDYGDACGRVPVTGLLWAAERRGLSCEILDLRNSGDTAGPRSEVVGYGAYAFTA